MLVEASLHFGWADYLIFTLTLVISLVIGVYYARKGAASSTSEYLFGGKSMGIFPIAMSFAARYTIRYIIISLFVQLSFFLYFCGEKFGFFSIHVGSTDGRLPHWSHDVMVAYFSSYWGPYFLIRLLAALSRSWNSLH